MGAAKGKQTDTIASCRTPPPPICSPPTHPQLRPDSFDLRLSVRFCVVCVHFVPLFYGLHEACIGDRSCTLCRWSANASLASFC